MIPSNIRPVPAEPPRKDVVADGARHPMSEQDAGGSHGHDMHPQKLVRLVGCHDPKARKHDEAA